MPRPHERRTGGGYPYFKLARWDSALCAWRDGRVGYPSEAFAKIVAHQTGQGRYRVSEVTADGRRDMEPFEVAAR